jgi:hypothetical protein
MVGCIKIRLAGAKSDDIAALGFQFGGPLGYRHGRRRIDTI